MVCHICLGEPKPTSQTNASSPVFQRLFGQRPLSLTSLPKAYRIPTYTNIKSFGSKLGMGHVIRDKQKLLNRVRRIRGQVEAVELALDGEAGCAQIMHQRVHEIISDHK
jgi:hypothetical protein